MDAQFLQHGHDPSLAGKCLLLVRVVESEGLFEGEQMLNAVATGERFLNRLDTRVATRSRMRASTAGLRSPARIALIIRKPIEPVILVSCTFISVKAFCICWI
ncbi:hypothetical protein ACVW0W_001379 [Bradyrhizobium sp. USDA 4469]